MAIHILSTWASKTVPSSFYLPAAAALCLLYSLQALANGRKNTRDRDMHGRVVLLTGAFTPIGLTLMHELAQRGAQIIALTPSLADPTVEELVSAIRTVTSNEFVYAEECDLTSPASIRSFCKQFLATTASGPASNIPGAPRDPPRLDGIVFAHEYTHIGSIWSRSDALRSMEENIRLEGGLATFMLMSSLLPCLIKAPGDRDIRVVSVVNPLYAASVPTYLPPLPPPNPDDSDKAQGEKVEPVDRSATVVPEPPEPTNDFQARLAQLARASTSSLEGHRALRSILLMRHLQRVLDALAAQSNKPVPSADATGSVTVHHKSTSNIIAVSVAPGFSRDQTIAPYLGARKESEGYWVLGFWIYIFLYPLIALFAKNSTGASQTILYALFAPTPRSRVDSEPEPESEPTPAESSPDPQSPSTSPKVKSQPVPRLKGGLLYRECKPTQLPGRGVALMDAEAVGRAVWEEMERGVEVWERSEGEVLKELAQEVEKEAQGKGKESAKDK